MMCNGTKKPSGKEYFYYKCKDCAIYIREGVIDKYLGKSVYKITTSEMKNEKDALKYIEILKKKYNFSVIKWENDENCFFNR